MRLIPVEPIGRRRAFAFVERANGGSFEEVGFAEYPPSPDAVALRTARVNASVGLRELARRARVRAVDLSSLERGSATTDEDGWRALHAAIAALVEERAS